MTRLITPSDVLNLGLSDDETRPVLMVNDRRMPHDEIVRIPAGVLALWVVGLLSVSADALAEAGASRRRSKAH